MTCIVQKFGGTSVADVEHIKNVARRVKEEVDRGNQVAVIVSAMTGVTNELVKYCREMSHFHDAREYDVVVSTGEQVTIGLLTMALHDIEISARSWTGWQIPIMTDGAHSKARIENINIKKLKKCMADGQVAVIAGFQGLAPNNRIATLGRGGSDTSAVSLAAALKADRCDIYTDVDGVYTTDPSIVPTARKLDKITYEEMLEMASLGAKVLQTRSVEMAMKHNVRLQVRSSFSNESGTFVCSEEEIMEKEVISGIAYSRDEAKLTLVGVKDSPGVSATIFGLLADENINVDMIVQDVSENGEITNMTFTVTKADFGRTINILKDNHDKIGYINLITDENVVKVSVVGVGMRSHCGVALTMFQALAEKGINIQVISTSEIKISVLISEEYTELALRALHTAYNMDDKKT